MPSCFLSQSNTLRVQLVRTFIRPGQISSSLPACAQTLAKGQERATQPVGSSSQALLVMQDLNYSIVWFPSGCKTGLQMKIRANQILWAHLCPPVAPCALFTLAEPPESADAGRFHVLFLKET